MPPALAVSLRISVHVTEALSLVFPSPRPETKAIHIDKGLVTILMHCCVKQLEFLTIYCVERHHFDYEKNESTSRSFAELKSSKLSGPTGRQHTASSTDSVSPATPSGLTSESLP